ncbi:MAG TPA: GNAT family N-acetyltransferase [Thermoguttaceae bacterium]|nr:GNAT family N-acetyltransferase [Thermoguttaceae bacterium]HPP53822.1 GNAT family N-acetyltransferase [Thermoguttaceae bacterium]
MIHFRSFRNTDPPLLAAIWQSQSPQPGLRQPVSVDLLEQLVLAKPYFHYPGLILACEDRHPIGFIHAGFGPNDEETALQTDYGVICLLMVRPDCPQAEVAEGLLRQAERYLTDRGAKVLYGGGVWPLCPFYLGLYGGSKLPGVLLSDSLAQQLYPTHGYREVDRTLVFQCTVDLFRPPVHRGMIQVRRSMRVKSFMDPRPRSWWEACLMANFSQMLFHLVPKEGGQPVAWAMLRDLEPEGTSTLRAVGLLELEVSPPYRGQGMATFLISEIFRYLQSLGVEMVETQTMARNHAAVNLYQKLGFVETNQGIVFRKDHPSVECIHSAK